MRLQNILLREIHDRLCTISSSDSGVDACRVAVTKLLQVQVYVPASQYAKILMNVLALFLPHTCYAKWRVSVCLVACVTVSLWAVT